MRFAMTLMVGSCVGAPAPSGDAGVPDASAGRLSAILVISVDKARGRGPVRQERCLRRVMPCMCTDLVVWAISHAGSRAFSRGDARSPWTRACRVVVVARVEPGFRGPGTQAILRQMRTIRNNYLK